MTQIRFRTFNDRIRFLGSVFLQYKKQIIFFFGIEIIVAVLSAVVPYFTKLQIDQLQNRSTSFLFFPTLSPVSIFIIALVTPLLIELIRQFVLERISRKVMLGFETRLRLTTEKLVWQKLETLDAGFFENKRNQRILNWILSASRTTQEAFRFLRSRLGNFVTLFSIIPLLGLVSWQLMVLVGVATVLQVILNELTRKQELALSLIQEKQNEKFWRIDNALTNDYQTLRILGATEYFLQEYHQFHEKQDRDTLQREAQRDRLRVFDWLVSSGLTLGANLFVGWQVLQGRVTLGTFSLVIAYTLQLSGIFRNLLESMKEWQETNLGFDRLDFFFLLKPRIQVSSQPSKLPRKADLIVQNVQFMYPDFYGEERAYIQMMIDKTKSYLKNASSYYLQYELEDWQKLLSTEVSQKVVLEDVNMKIPQGKIVALLGRNGAGKTTTTQLLMHQYEPTKGQVLLGTKNVREYQQQQLLQQFGVIQQHPFILNRFSVKENLLLGVKRAVSDNEIWELLERIDLKHKVEELSKKLDTILGEDTSFSGGQEQLLAVARVFLQRRPFLIFDEGMSQMDIEHETKVVSLLKEQRDHAAILFITHRITTARKADYIYMLDQGKIVEEGTHTQLLEKNGLYAKFWRMQVVE